MLGSKIETLGSGNVGSLSARETNSQLLKWRILLAIFLTGSSIFVHFLDSEHILGPGLIGSLGLLYTSMAATWAAIMAGASGRILTSLQLAADVLCIGLLVHFSGGPYSAFPLMFCVPILFGAYYLGARWAVTIAGAASIFTGGGHFGLALGWILAGSSTRLEYLQGRPVMITAVHIIIFLVVGLVSADLARRLAWRRRHQAKSVRAVENAHHEVRSILDNIQSGLISINCKGTITRVNPSCCRILELPEAELLGENIEHALAGGMENLSDIIRPVADGSVAVNRGEVRINRLGREVPVGMNVNPVMSPSGKISGAIAIFTDLTQEKEMNARMRESDRLAAIGELAASIAHEIRNPLASIRGSVEILAGDLELVDYQGQLMELVLKESARVNTIINDFLAYSRMRPASLRRIYGVEFRDEVTLQIRQHVVAKGGQVNVTCDISSEELEVVADPGQLTQMALNLAINGCEAMDYKGRLKIALNQRDQGQTNELIVTDSGPGIDEGIREDLFAPFKTTKPTGTGLGLSIVARIASAHGGRAKAEDAPGGGAVFRIVWPQKEEQNSHPANCEVSSVKSRAYQLV